MSGISTLWLIAAASATVPVELPPEQPAAAWAELLRAADMAPGPAAGFPAVHIEAGTRGWTLLVRDSSGAEHRVTVSPPTDEATREDLVWLAASLLRPVVPPDGLASAQPEPEPPQPEPPQPEPPTPSPEPPAPSTEHRVPSPEPPAPSPEPTAPSPEPPAPSPEPTETTKTTETTEPTETTETTEPRVPRPPPPPPPPPAPPPPPQKAPPPPDPPAPTPEPTETTPTPETTEPTEATETTEPRVPSPEPPLPVPGSTVTAPVSAPRPHPTLFLAARIGAAGRPSIAPTLASGASIGLRSHRDWRLAATVQIGPSGVTLVHDQRIAVSSWELGLALDSPRLLALGPRLGVQGGASQRGFEAEGERLQQGWVPTAALALTQPVLLTEHWSLEPRLAVARDLRITTYELPDGIQQDHPTWAFQGGLGLCWTAAGQTE